MYTNEQKQRLSSGVTARGAGWPLERLPILLAAIMVTAITASGSNLYDPIALHPENPHYFLWRGQPTVLITSGEHYGAVLNRAFDYGKYLDTLAANGFNLTRTFSGAYCEPPGAFGIEQNTLAPAASQLICPWARSDVPGYANGGNKFDLTHWNPDYFRRLRDFVDQASRRGVVVELVLFCPFYEDSMWDLSPMNAKNNINGIGQMERTDVYTLKNEPLLAIQKAMTTKVVQELKDFDNLYFEICNEPYFGGVTLEWQNAIAQTIVEAESSLARKHLIAQNIANKSKVIETPNPNILIFNFHYAKPPITVSQNYRLNKVIGDDETGFAGDDRVKPYRLEGWDFIIAGGAVYSNLDYSFAVGHEDGSAQINAPGGGGPVLWKQLKVLKDFIEGFDFIHMTPDDSVITGGTPKDTTARALTLPGKAYAIYINGHNVKKLSVNLPPGPYKAQWLNPKTGDIDKIESIVHSGGSYAFTAPQYSDDIALSIVRTSEKRHGLLFESDFEDGRLDQWKISGNAPTITRDTARAGTRAMQTSLDRHSDKVSYRTEVSGPHAEVGQEYWYGFSILLPESYVPDKIWEIVAQWHGVPDQDTGETWRNPIMALSTNDGKWSWVNRWDAKRNTFESGKRQYGGTKHYDLGPYRTDVWTDWVIHVKWSYKDDGILEIWKNGQKVIDQKGPNTFNDKHGPYFKMGLYKGWRTPDTPSDAVSQRLLYHDEFRMGRAKAGYANVAPGS